MNLDTLRRKRVKRKGVKATAHTGQQRIFLILDRATRKFHGDVGLWMQYIEYARKQKANKKVSRIITEVLRMHPTKPELWIYAAKYAIDVQADVQAARGFLQRGLRFCQTSRSLYLEYARLEMSYIAKIAVRRKILGLDVKQSAALELEPNTDDADADMIALPTYTALDVELAQEKSSENDGSVAAQITLTPAMTGAIPSAIFDAAMKQFQYDQALGEQFFDMFAIFDQVPSTAKIIHHVVESLTSATELSAAALNCRCKLPLVGVATNSPEYPSALGTALKEVKASMHKVPSQASALAEKVICWLSPLADIDGLAPELKKVISSTVRQLSNKTKDHPMVK